jgi:hypothetical protein
LAATAFQSKESATPFAPASFFTQRFAFFTERSQVSYKNEADKST